MTSSTRVFLLCAWVVGASACAKGTEISDTQIVYLPILPDPGTPDAGAADAGASVAPPADLTNDPPADNQTPAP
jgi:hypothetical protein